MDPVGQERMSDAILKLKKYGSYGDVIWFGFGIKHIVTDLAETQQGLTLVALCAALSTTYDPLYAAKVLNELCVLCKAPQEFSPAIRQWRQLVELCAGILDSGHFLLKLEGFRRLFSPCIISDTHIPYPTSYSKLAEALMTIGLLSTRNLHNARFVGGHDCIWLTAVAEWIFCLDVAVHNSEGALIYRSAVTHNHVPSLVVQYEDKVSKSQTRSYSPPRVVKSKTSLLLSTRSLIVREDHTIARLHRMKWPSSWSTILIDTFPEWYQQIISSGMARQLGIFLYGVSISMFRQMSHHSHAKYSAVDSLICAHPDSRGHRFLHFAERRLPELKPCFAKGYPDKEWRDALQDGFAARESLTASNDDDIRYGNETILEAIVYLLWISLASEIDDDINPSVSGLHNLCKQFARREPFINTSKKLMRLDLDGARHTELVFLVFSGTIEQSFGKRNARGNNPPLAIAGSGICVFRQVLEDLNSPLETISRYRIVRGHISHLGSAYKGIRSLSDAFWGPELPMFTNLDIIKSMSLRVEYTELDDVLAVAYQIHYSGSENHISCLDLDVSRLLRFMRKGYCNGITDMDTSGCSPPNGQHESVKDDGDHLLIYSKRGRKQERYLIKKESIELARTMISSIHPSLDGWIAADVSMCRESKLLSAFVAVDAALRSYLIHRTRDERLPGHIGKGPKNITIFKYTGCADCILERSLPTYPPSMGNGKGTLTLAMPDGRTQDILLKMVEKEDRRVRA